jgi:hypothetical protein
MVYRASKRAKSRALANWRLKGLHGVLHENELNASRVHGFQEILTMVAVIKAHEQTSST